MKRKLLIVCVLLIIFLLPAIWLNTQTGVTVQGHFLRKTSPGVYGASTDWRITHDEGFSRFEATLAGKLFAASVETDGSHAVFTFDDGNVIEGQWVEGLGLIGPEGTPLRFTEGISIVVNNEMDQYHFTPGSVANVWAAILMGETETFGHISLVLCGVALYAFGAAHLLWPDRMHFLFARWRYSQAELSDSGIAAEKLGGMAMMAIGIGVMFAPLFL